MIQTTGDEKMTEGRLTPGHLGTVRDHIQPHTDGTGDLVEEYTPSTQMTVVREVTRGAWHEDGSPVISDRWSCPNLIDASQHLHVRRIEAHILNRTDSSYDIWDGREVVEPTELLDFQGVYGDLIEMGYTVEQIKAALDEE